jgi:hypothetical protein
MAAVIIAAVIIAAFPTPAVAAVIIAGALWAPGCR